MNTTPKNLRVDNAPIIGLYVRHWTANGIQIDSCYERGRGYSAEIKLFNGKTLDFNGRRARKIFEYIQRIV